MSLSVLSALSGVLLQVEGSNSFLVNTTPALLVQVGIEFIPWLDTFFHFAANYTYIHYLNQDD